VWSWWSFEVDAKLKLLRRAKRHWKERPGLKRVLKKSGWNRKADPSGKELRKMMLLPGQLRHLTYSPEGYVAG
jgi:hypothetical protein